MEINYIYCGDALAVLKTFPNETINCCITSPPYWGLRDYGTAKWEGGDANCDHKTGRFERGNLSEKQMSNTGSDGDEATNTCPKCGAIRIDSQIGLEETSEQYVGKLVEVFREVKRVLRNDGTVWLNLGDTYNAGRNGGWAGGTEGISRPNIAPKQSGVNAKNLKPKDLVGIPWMVAFALRADGWYLRQDIIWHKPNPMPESVTDRCTKSHECVFLLAKSQKYHYDADAIKEKAAYDGRTDTIMKGSPKYADGFVPEESAQTVHARGHERWNKNENGICVRNKRSVWTVNTLPFEEAHFATFPEKLIEPMIKAGCPEQVCSKCGKPREKIIEKIRDRIATRGKQDYSNASVNQPQQDTNGGFPKVEEKTIGYTNCGCGAPFVPGIVLDPFMGAGTTALVARKLYRNFIGIELNLKYVEMANQRISTAMQQKGIYEFDYGGDNMVQKPSKEETEYNVETGEELNPNEARLLDRLRKPGDDDDDDDEDYGDDDDF